MRRTVFNISLSCRRRPSTSTRPRRKGRARRAVQVYFLPAGRHLVGFNLKTPSTGPHDFR